MQPTLLSMDRFLRFSARGAHLAWRIKNGAKCVPFKTVRELPDGSELVMLHESDGMRTRRRRETGNRHAPRLPDTMARLVTFTITAQTRSGRAKATQIRVLTTLLDHETFPAREIAALYAERWQVEIAFLHLKKTVRGPRRALRGQSPDLARQEAWALLLIHNIVATATARAAAEAGTDPRLIPFTAVLGLVRAHVAADTRCRHCGHRPTRPDAPLDGLTSAIIALPRHRQGRQRTSGRTAAERRTRHTEEVTYTIDITKSNLPKWTQFRKLKGSGVHTHWMADDLRAFDGWFNLNAWPSAPCPVCKVGDLHPSKGSVTTVTTTSYDWHRDDDGWEPDWEHGFFHGILYCGRSACKEKVIVSGEYRVTETVHWEYVSELRLRFAIPAFPLIIPPVSSPEAALEGIDAASRIVWTDPAGAANGLRRAVEAILDDQKVRKTKITGHKRRRLSTHQRIDILEAKQPVVATSLEAVKWLGNEGSHSSAVLTSSHCIESAEYLNHALRILYDKADVALIKKAKEINKARGLVR